MVKKKRGGVRGDAWISREGRNRIDFMARLAWEEGLGWVEGWDGGREC